MVLLNQIYYVFNLYLKSDTCKFKFLEILGFPMTVKWITIFFFLNNVNLEQIQVSEVACQIILQKTMQATPPNVSVSGSDTNKKQSRSFIISAQSFHTNVNFTVLRYLLILSHKIGWSRSKISEMMTMMVKPRSFLYGFTKSKVIH